MNSEFIPTKAQAVLLHDAIVRDRTTARRTLLLEILWKERSLIREQLITRVEGKLGRNCFGESSWKDTFYRDMRVVKRALKAAGYQMIYRRESTRRGYELLNQPLIAPELAKILDGSVAEVDSAQIAVIRPMTTQERFRLGFSICDTARKVVAYRIQQRNPTLNPLEAHRLALSHKQRQ